MRRTVGAVTLVAVVTLGGCDGDATPPDPSMSVTVPSPTPDDPTTSSAPQAETPEEFIRRWITVQNEMLATGAVTEYVELSRGCGPCKDTARRVRDVYAAGGFIDTDGWTVTGLKRSGGSGRISVYEVQIDNAPTRYAEREGGPVQELDAGTPLMQITLARRASGFLLSNLTQLSTA